MAINLATVTAPTTGTISSPGLGSGINVSQLVTNLVSASIQPQQTLLQKQQATDQANISALGVVQSALVGVQTAVASMTTGGALSSLTATSSNTAAFTAVASTGAVAGSYTVQVQALAQANTISSAAYTSASAVVGTGSVTLTAGGSSFTVTLDSTNNTLQGLANAINGASNNSGVSATIITGTDGAHLVLSAKQTGVANAVSVTTSMMAPFTTVTNASDAQVAVDGFIYKSSSNTVTGALSGVTLNLMQAQPTSTFNLTVGADTATASNAIQSFVTAYNSAVSLLLADTSYNTSTGASGPLIGDASVTSALQQLQAITAAQVPGNGANAITSLSQLGVSVNSDGTLSVNTSQLNTALGQNIGSVQNLIAGTKGIGTQLNTMLQNVAGSSGTLATESQGYVTDYNNAAQQLANLQAQSAQLTQLYTSEFNNMNTVVSKYNSLSSMLTQTFASWNNVSTTTNSSSG